jgi:hypothetical protein
MNSYIAEMLAVRAAAALEGTKEFVRTDRMIAARGRVKWWLAYGAQPRRARYVERDIVWLEEGARSRSAAQRFRSNAI